MKTPLFTKELVSQIDALKDHEYFYRCLFSNEIREEKVDAFERQQLVQATVARLNINPVTDEVNVRSDVAWFTNHVAKNCDIRRNPAQSNWTKYIDGNIEYYVNTHLNVIIQVFRDKVVSERNLANSPAECNALLVYFFFVRHGEYSM